MKTMLFFLLLLLFLCSTLCQSGNYTINQKYSYVGKAVINVASQIQAAGTSNWSNPINVNIPYPINIKYNSNTNLTAMAVFGDFQFSDFTNRVNVVTVLREKTQNYILVQIYSSLANYFKKISVFYMLILKESYYDDFRIYLLQQTFKDIGYDFRNSSLPSTFLIQVKMTAINFTGGVTSIGFISGLNAQLTNYSGSLQVVMQTQVKSSTLFIVRINSPTRTTYLLYMLMTIIVFNKGFSYSPSFKFHANIGDITFTKTSSNSYSNSSYQMANINTFIGLLGFKISYQNTFSFYSTVASNTITITSNNYFDSAVFSFLVVTSNYCEYSSPFYESVNKLCYSNCPGTFTSDNTTLSCVCYINNSLVNNNNCIASNPQPKEITQETVQQSSNSTISTAAIIGIAFGLVCMILIVVLIVFIKKNKEKREQKQNQDKNNNQSQLQNHKKQKKIIHFKDNQNQLQNCKDLVDDYINRQSQEEIIKQYDQLYPVFYIDGSLANSAGQGWRNAEETNQPEELCCICLQRRTFFKTSCKHNFHLTCITHSSLQRKCPYCRTELGNQGHFYCFICNKRYRIVRLDDFYLEKSLLNNNLSCDLCINTPL